jgi:porphobilinogen deaminase
LALDGVVLTDDGSQRIAAANTGPPEQAEQIGAEVAKRLLDEGAANLIATSRHPG